MTTHHLHIGGLVAIGFDATGEFMLTVTHAGRGVFRVDGWERLARDTDLAYPDDGFAHGIGPLSGQLIPVTEMAHGSHILNTKTPDGAYDLGYTEGTVTITSAR